MKTQKKDSSSALVSKSSPKKSSYIFKSTNEIISDIIGDIVFDGIENDDLMGFINISQKNAVVKISTLLQIRAVNDIMRKWGYTCINDIWYKSNGLRALIARLFKTEKRIRSIPKSRPLTVAMTNESGTLDIIQYVDLTLVSDEDMTLLGSFMGKNWLKNPVKSVLGAESYNNIIEKTKSVGIKKEDADQYMAELYDEFEDEKNVNPMTDAATPAAFDELQAKASQVAQSLYGINNISPDELINILQNNAKNCGISWQIDSDNRKIQAEGRMRRKNWLDTKRINTSPQESDGKKRIFSTDISNIPPARVEKFMADVSVAKFKNSAK